MKKIKVFITIFIVIIISLIIALFVINSFNKSNDYERNTIKNNIENVVINNIDKQTVLTLEDKEAYKDSYNKGEVDKELKYVQNNSTYYTMKALTNNYINLVSNKNKEKLKDILAPSYIEEYGITDNNILNIANIPEATDEISGIYKTTILEMLESQVGEDTYVYIVKGKARDKKENKISFKLLLEVDIVQKVYNIYPEDYIEDKGYSNLNVGAKFEEFKINKIQNRENNNFIYLNSKSNKDMANEYFSNYKELLNYYKEDAYNNLDTEYAKKRYGSKEEFYKYIEENKTLILTMQINEYKVIEGDNYKEFICSDQYDNIYIFREQSGIMRYSVFLDNYTILRKEDAQYYSELSKSDMAKNNLFNIMAKLNTKDYKSLYNDLDETFKNNNFATLEEFKKYVKNNFYDQNSLLITNSAEETYYVFTCRLSNLKNENETKNITFIINQLEGTNFTMSFSFNEQ